MTARLVKRESIRCAGSPPLQISPTPPTFISPSYMSPHKRTEFFCVSVLPTIAISKSSSPLPSPIPLGSIEVLSDHPTPPIPTNSKSSFHLNSPSTLSLPPVSRISDSPPREMQSTPWVVMKRRMFTGPAPSSENLCASSGIHLHTPLLYVRERDSRTIQSEQ